jgi:RimJ/RimL family protein N-acetyltransferase
MLVVEHVTAGDMDDHDRGSSVTTILVTERLILVPVTVGMVEAVMARDRRRLEGLLDARLPEAWPGDKLIHQGFGASLEDTRADPEKRLWGDRVALVREGGRRIVGSVIFHGRPDEDGIVEVGYGVEEGSRCRGYATEATRACVTWALGEPGVRAVLAVTTEWNLPSLRLIQKLGMRSCGTRDGGLLGDLLVFTTEDER